MALTEQTTGTGTRNGLQSERGQSGCPGIPAKPDIGRFCWDTAHVAPDGNRQEETQKQRMQARECHHKEHIVDGQDARVATPREEARHYRL